MNFPLVSLRSEVGRSMVSTTSSSVLATSSAPPSRKHATSDFGGESYRSSLLSTEAMPYARVEARGFQGHVSRPQDSFLHFPQKWRRRHPQDSTWIIGICSWIPHLQFRDGGVVRRSQPSHRVIFTRGLPSIRPMVRLPQRVENVRL